MTWTKEFTRRTDGEDFEEWTTLSVRAVSTAVGRARKRDWTSDEGGSR